MYATDRSATGSAPSPEALTAERVRTVSPSLVAALAALVAVWPYAGVINPGAWSFGVLSVIAVTALTGMGMRTLLRGRAPWLRDLVTLGAQVIAAVGAITLIVAGEAAVLGVFPTEGTALIYQAYVGSAWEQIVYGVAPLDATPGLLAVMTTGFALVAILLDQLVANRGAIVAVALTAVVGSVPTITTLGEPDLVWFVAVAVVVLVLLRHAAARRAGSPRRPSLIDAIVIGTVPVIATLVLAPALPLSTTLAGSGLGVTVDASLRLGDDLRQPNPVEVLTLATDASTAPYLRLTTLSEFDGRVWEPDRGVLQSRADGFGQPEWAEEIATAEQSTSIRVIRMSSSWLPTPYAATEVQGAPDGWRIDPTNRTLVSRSGDAAGADYTVTSTTVRPTAEQIRAASASPRVVDPEADPVEIPEVIGTTAAEVTASAGNDYDRLIALQSWFRNEFEYSLETPVQEGFDGTGADAVVDFLDARSGYCIHFAGAFALMADSLDMEVRIVVGYLPGTLTRTERGEESVYSVSSSQLHSWPEVLFPGIGWVPFEPTATLGVPTSFRTGTTAGGDSGSTSTPAPTAAPTEQQTTAPQTERPDAGENATGTGEQRRIDPTPAVLIGVGAVILLLLPAVIRLIVRARRRRAAVEGDAGAAWDEVRATLIDLRIPLSDAQSPRARAAALLAEGRVDAEAIGALATAVELASYARPEGRGPADVDAELSAVLVALRRSVDRGTRTQAFLLPRSLWVAQRDDSPLTV